MQLLDGTDSTRSLHEPSTESPARRAKCTVYSAQTKQPFTNSTFRAGRSRDHAFSFNNAHMHTCTLTGISAEPKEVFLKVTPEVPKFSKVGHLEKTLAAIMEGLMSSPLSQEAKTGANRMKGGIAKRDTPEIG